MIGGKQNIIVSMCDDGCEPKKGRIVRPQINVLSDSLLISNVRYYTRELCARGILACNLVNQLIGGHAS